ncbi:MAG: hypothetical protein ACOYOA_17055 [Saprospiraceae bacterium]
MNLQEKIIEAISTKLEHEKDWRDKLATTLHLSKSTIYKRLNGITPFTPEEIGILITEFGISFDGIVLQEHNNRVIFKVPPTHQRISNFDEYLTGIENTFRPVEQFDNVQVFIMTRDLPLFYYFKDVDVALFNLYVYGRFMWELDSCLKHPFSLNNMYLIPDIQKKISTIWDKYAELDTVEYWQSNALDVTLHQLQYFWEAGAIPAEEAFRVLDGLARIISYAKNMTLLGFKNLNDKTKGGDVELYHNRIMSAENIILARTDGQETLHIILDPSRFIVTFDPMMTRTAQNTISLARKNAYFLGEGSGNAREEFFNVMNRKIEQLKKKIELATQVIGF